MPYEQDATAFVLVVIHPFADYQKGQRITDPNEIDKVLSGECASYVNKTPAAE
ncbi:hypothetical protein [Paludibacterium denitrificans]|uniref:hypothetical protein n=1 Tax=Paludibacterium denitrificans TaxID=2675226 RepID=UPI001E5ACBF1|nr:hypothetical protein [Paludibacterium denitrificans]